MTKHSRSFASYYDFYDGAEYRESQLACYVELARETGDPILELASGTGIITHELARAGFNVTGLDISPEMISVARAKLSREKTAVQERVKYVEADMADFDLGKEFQMILIPTNSFGYLTTMDAQKSCLAAAYRHLASGGTIVIEERFYTPDVIAGVQARRAAPTIQMAGINPETGKYTTFHTTWRDIDITRQTIYTLRFIEELESDGTIRQLLPEDGGRGRNHFFNIFELQLLLEQAGFEVAHIWGGYDRRSVKSASRSMIFVARKK